MFLKPQIEDFALEVGMRIKRDVWGLNSWLAVGVPTRQCGLRGGAKHSGCVNRPLDSLGAKVGTLSWDKGGF